MRFGDGVQSAALDHVRNIDTKLVERWPMAMHLPVDCILHPCEFLGR